MYEIIVEGRNFNLPLENKNERVGFFTTIEFDGKGGLKGSVSKKILDMLLNIDGFEHQKNLHAYLKLDEVYEVDKSNKEKRGFTFYTPSKLEKLVDYLVRIGILRSKYYILMSRLKEF